MTLEAAREQVMQGGHGRLCSRGQRDARALMQLSNVAVAEGASLFRATALILLLQDQDKMNL